MGDFIGLDNDGNPIYGEAPKKETGKSFNDAIKDLFWDVLGREPSPRELSAYSRDFGAKIDPDEEQIFFDRSQKEIQGRNDPILNLYQEATGGREPTLEEYRSTRKELGGDVSAEERASFLEQYVDPSFKQQYEDLSASDPVYRLFSQELGRKPTLAEYRQFEGNVSGTPTEQQRLAARASDPEVYGTQLMDQYRYMTGGQEPTEEQKRMVYETGMEKFTPQNIGSYLAQQNLAGRSRYAPSVAPMFGGAYDPAQRAGYRFDYQDPFAQFSVPTQSQAPRVSQTMQMAGQSFYQPPSTPGVNYMNAPTNIAPITQGYQPVGMPTFLGGKGMPQQTRSFPSQTTNLGSPAYTQPTQINTQSLANQATMQMSPQGIAGKGGRTSSALNTPMSAPDPTAFRALTGKG
jgi:hypothetical protein